MLFTSDTLIPWRPSFKPRGTCLITSGKITSHVIKKSNDYPLGRWSLIEIGHSKKKRVICNAYIVGMTPISHARNNTAAYPQWVILSKKELRSTSTG